MAARLHTRDRYPRCPRSFNGRSLASHRESDLNQAIAVKLRNWLPCLSAGLVVLVIDSLTLAPTVTGEDSGEFITAAWFFGVPHPPGYPLWTLLCGAFMHVFDVGIIAWRANLFSALCTSFAVFVLAGALGGMGFRPLVAAAAAAVAGLTDSVWSQSVITEVYTLNLLIMAGLLLCIVRWHSSGQTRWLVGGSLLAGLGMANHHLLGFAILAMALWVVWELPALLRNQRVVLRCAVAFTLGLLPYAYPLWAARRAVPVRWGETTTLSALWDHVTRRQYKGTDPGNDQAQMTTALMAGRVYYGLRWEVREFTPLLAPFLMAGLVWLWRRKCKRIWLGLTIALAICCGLIFLYVGGPRLDRQDEFVQKVFLTPMALISAIPLAAGLQWLTATLRRIRIPLAKPNWPRGFTRAWRRGLAAGVVAVCAVAVPVSVHWRENNFRHYWWAYDHAHNLLACMLPDAIIFPSGDHNTFPLIYLVHVEGMRPDVTIADKYGYIDLDLYRDMPNNPGKPQKMAERQAIEEWITRHAHRPIYYTVKSPTAIENTRWVAVGLTYHLLPDKQSVDTQSCWSEIRYRNLEDASAPEDLAASNILSDYHFARAVRWLEQGRIEPALTAVSVALKHARGLRETFNNVASALAEAGQTQAAIGYYETAARLDWAYAPARWNLAKIFSRTDQPVWAAKVYQDLAQATPKDFRVFGELGFLYHGRLQDPHQAREWFYESLRLNPQQPQIIKALAEIEALARPSSQPSAITSQPAKSQATTKPSLTSQPEQPGRLEIAPEFLDLGRVVEGRSIERPLVLTNRGSGPLCIHRIDRSCSCVLGWLNERTLGSGESISVPTGIQTTGKYGVTREMITIHSDDPIEPARKIAIAANVVPLFELTPARIVQEHVPDEPFTPIKLQIRNNANETFRISQILGPTALAIQWDKNRDGTAFEVAVSAASENRFSGSGSLSIYTDCAGGPIDVPVMFSTINPFTADPPLVYVGRVGIHEKVERDVWLRPVRRGAGWRPAAVESPGGACSATLEPSGERWLIKLAVDGEHCTVGPIKELVRVRVVGCEQPLEITVHGFVSD